VVLGVTFAPMSLHQDRSLDPLIRETDFHPDDARAYIQKINQVRFDRSFYPHTTSSYYTNIRLESYVRTLQSMRRTWELLKPNGVFVLSFSSERPWFAGRMRSRTWAP
jgi:hypothetical protein